MTFETLKIFLFVMIIGFMGALVNRLSKESNIKVEC